MTCINAAAGSSTTLPNTVGGTITPVLGDVVTCTITNTRKAANAQLTMTKVSTVVSDLVNGTTNPKAIPDAIIRHTITVRNTGSPAVDSSRIVIIDPLPTPAGLTPMCVASASRRRVSCLLLRRLVSRVLVCHF
jgi:hypothetical protein